MKFFQIALATFFISGCVSLDSLTSDNGEQRDTSFYLLDLKNRWYCNGNTRECLDITKIVSSRAQLLPLEKEYNQEIKGPNYPVSFIRMVMQPKDGSYKTTQVGDEGRYHKVPKNDKTDLVWSTLSQIQTRLHDQF